MGWNEVDLTQVNPTIDPVAEGKYVFQLLSAKYSPRDPSEINCKAVITDGEFAGRILFFNYPDPERFAWSPKALKRFEGAIGVECEDGEDKVAWLNRATGSKFLMGIKHDRYTPEGSDREVVKEKLLTFSVAPAA